MSFSLCYRRRFQFIDNHRNHKYLDKCLLNRSVARSVARSLGCSRGRTFAQSFARSLDGSLGLALVGARSLGRSIARALFHLVATSYRKTCCVSDEGSAERASAQLYIYIFSNFLFRTQWCPGRRGSQRRQVNVSPCKEIRRARQFCRGALSLNYTKTKNKTNIYLYDE